MARIWMEADIVTPFLRETVLPWGRDGPALNPALFPLAVGSQTNGGQVKEMIEHGVQVIGAWCAQQQRTPILAAVGKSANGDIAGLLPVGKVSMTPLPAVSVS